MSMSVFMQIHKHKWVSLLLGVFVVFLFVAMMPKVVWAGDFKFSDYVTYFPFDDSKTYDYDDNGGDLYNTHRIWNYKVDMTFIGLETSQDHIYPSGDNNIDLYVNGFVDEGIELKTQSTTNSSLESLEGGIQFLEELDLLTINFMIKIDDLAPYNKNMILYRIGSKEIDELYHEFIIKQNGALNFRAMYNDQVQYSVTSNSTTILSDKKWHMITLVREHGVNSQISMYVDGVVVSDDGNTINTINALSNSDGYFIINMDDNSMTIHSYLDEFGVWDYAFDSTEIYELYTLLKEGHSPIKPKLTNFFYILSRDIGDSRGVLQKVYDMKWDYLTPGSQNVFFGISSDDGKWYGFTVEYFNIGHPIIELYNSDSWLKLTGTNTVGNLGIDDNHDLYMWVDEDPLQIGLEFDKQPILLDNTNNWVDLRTSSGHVFGLTDDGKWYSWGWNGCGQLGLGDNDDRSTPEYFGDTNEWVDIRVYNDHTRGLNADGNWYAWGCGGGEVNYLMVDSESYEVWTPTTMYDADEWVDFANSGMGGFIGLKKDGKWYAQGIQWDGDLFLGDDFVSELSPPDFVSELTPIIDANQWVKFIHSSDGGAGLGLNKDGYWYAVGNFPYYMGINISNNYYNNYMPQKTRWHSDEVDFLGFFYTLALDQLLLTGMPETPPITLTPFEKINIDILSINSVKANVNFIDDEAWSEVVLKEKGIVYDIDKDVNLDNAQKIIHQKKTNEDYTITIVGLDENLKYYLKAYAIDENDEIYYSDEVSFRSGEDNVARWYAWGDNTKGVLGIGGKDNVVHMTEMPDSDDWIDFTTGYSHTMGLKKDYSLYVWGNNTYGQLGIGDYVERLTPTPFTPKPYLLNIHPEWDVADWVVTLFVGNSSFANMNTEQNVYGWGQNDPMYHQLGLLNEGYYNTPQYIGNFSILNHFGMIKSASSTTGLGYKGFSYVYGWGSNWDYQAGVVEYPHSPLVVLTPKKILDGYSLYWVQASNNNGYGLLIDGNWLCWGLKTGCNYPLTLTGYYGDTPPTLMPNSNKIVRIIPGGDGRVVYILKNDGKWYSLVVEKQNFQAILTGFDDGDNGYSTWEGGLSEMDDANKWLYFKSGKNITYGLKNDGCWYAMGYNTHGELGLGFASDTNEYINKFVKIPYCDRWESMVIGDSHVFGLLKPKTFSTAKADLLSLTESNLQADMSVYFKNKNYKILRKGFIWHTDINKLDIYTIDANHIWFADSNDDTEFNYILTELEPNQTYYVKAFVEFVSDSLIGQNPNVEGHTSTNTYTDIIIPNYSDTINIKTTDAMVSWKFYDETNDTLIKNHEIIITNHTNNKTYFADANGLFEYYLYELEWNGEQNISYEIYFSGELMYTKRNLQFIYENKPGNNYDYNIYALPVNHGVHIDFLVKTNDSINWKNRYIAFKKDDYIISINKTNEIGEITAYVKDDGDYIAYLYDTDGVLKNTYLKTQVKIKKPKDEKTGSNILPYNIYVGGLLSYNIIDTNASSNIINIFGGTISTYDFTIIDYSADPIDANYIPRTYNVRNPFGAGYNPVYTLQPYLVSKDDGVIPSIITYDELKVPYPNITISIFKRIGGEYTLIEQKVTDSTGRTSFSGYPLDLYEVYLYKENNELAGKYKIQLRDSQETFYFIVNRDYKEYFSYKGVDLKYNWGDTPSAVDLKKDLKVYFNAVAHYMKPIAFTKYTLLTYQNNMVVETKTQILDNDEINLTINLDKTKYKPNIPIKVEMTLELTYNNKTEQVKFVKTIGTSEQSLGLLNVVKNFPKKIGYLWTIILSLLLTAGALVLVGTSDFVSKDYLLYIGLLIVGFFVFIGWFQTGVKVAGIDVMWFLYILSIIVSLGFALIEARK